MAGWDDVRRLQADFAAVQRSSTKQKLSERNLVEIVNKLIELQLIKVIYTTDGKEYLTLQQLEKEINEELYVHGGRINLIELQQILNVDFSHVETKVNEMVKKDSNLTLVLGQLLNRSYRKKIAEEINDKLQDRGYISVAEITDRYDLPIEFVHEVINKSLGMLIKGKTDNLNRDIIYTDMYVSRIKATIRGLFSAVTRPTALYSICHKYNFQELLFYSTVEELVTSKRVLGILTGKHDSATFHPDLYISTQMEWVNNFYKQNGYLEYDSLVRLGISETRDYIKKCFKNEPLIYLSTCCVGLAIREQLEANIEEALNTGLWVDILPLLPSVFSTNDISQLLTVCLKDFQDDTILWCDTIVSSKKFIAECNKPFSDIMKSKAEKEALSNPAVFKVINTAAAKKSSGKETGADDTVSSKDQRRKKGTTGSGSTKLGGGSQGREVKVRSTKKKYKMHSTDDANFNEDSTGRHQPSLIKFLDVEEIEEILRKQPHTKDAPDEFIFEIASYLHRPLTEQYQEIAKSLFSEATGVSSSAERKRTYNELQEKISGLWTNVLLFEKGLKFFPEDTETQLSKHLLKTICTDITNLVVTASMADHVMASSPEKSSQMTTPESRLKSINQLPESEKVPLLQLHSALNKSLDDFQKQLDIVCGPEHLGLLLKKPDKKKEKQLVFSHRQTLLEELTQEEDAAMSLHLTALILFQAFTQTLVHAPGRYVPKIIEFLMNYIPKDSFSILLLFQDLIVQSMKLRGDEHKEVIAKIEELLPQVKQIALSTKKNVMEKTDDK